MKTAALLLSLTFLQFAGIALPLAADPGTAHGHELDDHLHPHFLNELFEAFRASIGWTLRSGYEQDLNGGHDGAHELSGPNGLTESGEEIDSMGLIGRSGDGYDPDGKHGRGYGEGGSGFGDPNGRHGETGELTDPDG